MNVDQTLKYLTEPALTFRFEQNMTDPHDGLFLFGPFDTDAPSHPKNITYGLVGRGEGIYAFHSFADALKGPLFVSQEIQNRRLWPPFPGFEAAFHCSFFETPAAQIQVDSQELSIKSQLKDQNKRAYNVVDLYLEGIKTISKRDENFDVIICVVPDEVWLNCRPQSRPITTIGQNISGRERRLRASGQIGIFDDFNWELYRMSTDFRRQIKARAMEFGIPIQIIRESTLSLEQEIKIGSRKLTSLSDRAWNLSTALYYKSGGKPWRLSTAREGVSYVGLSFRKSNASESSRTAVCAAQMFIDTGDGIVFLGESGPWYSPEDKQYHLSNQAAYNLLTGVINTYRELDGRPLTEIFLHSKSEISKEEFQGYRKACPSNVKLVGIRVRGDQFGIRLFREGSRPVLRGTFLRIKEGVGFLWTTGFKPELGTYDGWEVPVPLKIDIQHGESDIQQVAQDILSLTKLNYNACKIGSSQPVTVGFSDAVGEILVSNPDIKVRRPQFKYYI